VPFSKRVKISSTNIGLETTVPQKEETFQVVINLIKNPTCFKAFTIFADVPQIFMQQFCKTKAEEAEASRKVHDTHARIVTESVPESTKKKSGGKSSKSVVIQDTLSSLKSKLSTSKYKLKCTQSLTPAEKEAADIMQALKESKKSSKRQPGKKNADTHVTEVDVSKESNPKPAKKKTSSNRRVKKKVTLSANDNIISDNPDAALELAKSISKTKAEEAEASRKVHDTHARIVTESVPESTKKKSGGKSSKSVVIQDTLSSLKSKLSTSKYKLKCTQSLTPAEKEAADIMQALKESKNKETGTKPSVPDEEKDIIEEKDDKDDDVDDEGDDHISDTQDANDDDDETKSDEDKIYKYTICVRKDEDEEITNAEVEEFDKGDEEVTDAAKEDAKKTTEVKDDTMKWFEGETINLPPIPKILIETLVSIVVSSPQVTPIISYVQPITTYAPTITTVVLESNALITVELRVAKLEKGVSELKTVDHSTKALTIPTVDLEQKSEKSSLEILKIKKEQAEKQKMLKFTIKSTDKA
nr:hypothetical protein [Tanacetum cinerariifolium]